MAAKVAFLYSPNYLPFLKCKSDNTKTWLEATAQHSEIQSRSKQTAKMTTILLYSMSAKMTTIVLYSMPW